MKSHQSSISSPGIELARLTLIPPQTKIEEKKSSCVISPVESFHVRFSYKFLHKHMIEKICLDIKNTLAIELKFTCAFDRPSIKTVLNVASKNPNILVWNFEDCVFLINHPTEGYYYDNCKDEISHMSKKNPRVSIIIINNPPAELESTEVTSMRYNNITRLHLTNEIIGDPCDQDYSNGQFNYVGLFNCMIRVGGFLKLPTSVDTIKFQDISITIDQWNHLADYIAKCKNLTFLQLNRVSIRTLKNPDDKEHLKNMFKKMLQALSAILISHPNILHFSITCVDPEHQLIVKREAVIYQQMMIGKMNPMILRNFGLFNGVRELIEITCDYLDERPQFFLHK